VTEPRPPLRGGRSTDHVRRRLPWHGWAAVACWAIHGGNHVLRGTPHDLLWACNIAVPMLAVGCFFGLPLACAIAYSWLAFGTPIWILDLATGKGMIPTSVFVHLVAPLIAVFALRKLGWPRHVWLATTVASALLLVVTRLVGSPRQNVNLAFRVHDGWEKTFHAHAVWLALLFGASVLVFFVVDKVASRFIGGRTARTEPRRRQD
jgi:hypothetical protein